MTSGPRHVPAAPARGQVSGGRHSRSGMPTPGVRGWRKPAHRLNFPVYRHYHDTTPCEARKTAAVSDLLPLRSKPEYDPTV